MILSLIFLYSRTYRFVSCCNNPPSLDFNYETQGVEVIFPFKLFKYDSLAILKGLGQK